MTRNRISFLLLSCTLASATGCPKPIRVENLLEPPPRSETSNVILVTLDGVRGREFFGERPDEDLLPAGRTPRRPFARFWRDLAHRGIVYGAPGKSAMTISNDHVVSLPAYHSIMAGATQPCSGNGCGRITVETLPERLVRDLGLRREQAAVIASWSKIALAAESREDAVFVNAGQAELVDPSMTSQEASEINEAQRADPSHDPEARWDRYTMAHAMRYLIDHEPRFLWISLNDSDEWAHQGRYDLVLDALEAQDRFLVDLAEKLGTMGAYGGNTTLIVTTDHGRGETRDGRWRNHGKGLPEARPVWLFAMGRYTGRGGIYDEGIAHEHNDIRGTIELLFGLCPSREPRASRNVLLGVLAGIVDQDIVGCMAP